MRLLFSRLSVPARVAVLYATASSMWIIVSDGLVGRMLHTPAAAWMVSEAKGLLFVAVSAVLLYLLVRRYVARSEGAEVALRVSNDRWQFALEVAGDGVWDWNGQTRRMFFSPRWKAMLGYAEHEIGDSVDEWADRIHPEDRALVNRELKAHYCGRTKTYVCEHRLRTKDGAYKWVLSRGRVISRTPRGRPLRAIGTHTDITARREAEERIADALDFQQTMLRAAPVGILTFRADGWAISANEAAVKFTGEPIEVLRTQNFRKLEHWREQGLLAAAEEALAQNRVVHLQAKVQSSCGRTTWGELTFSPFRYEGEQRLLLILQDVTEMRQAVERMKLLHAALEAAPAGWVVTDPNGVIEWVNPSFTKMTGYPLAEAVGRRMSLLKSGRHSPGFYSNLWHTVREGRIWEGELYNRRKDGSFYYERMTIAPVRDGAGPIEHFVAMKEDVTGQHELEQQLARSQRLESVGLLASGLAHDLNNMLAPIMLSVGLVKAKHPDRETHELLDMMQKAAQRGAGVVQQILTFARGVEGQRVQVDVRPLVKEMAQLARETFPREIRVTVDVPRTSLFVEGDVTQLHQVLLNLAVNARDAMVDGGVLTLKAELATLDHAAARALPGCKPGNYVKMTVADTGTGITPEVLEHVFEPFFTTKPRGKGTGLGLSTVYGIVRSHGGTVDVQSRLGEGTAFSIFLPHCAEAPATPAGPGKDTIVVKGAGRCVLLVDDEASIRKVTAQVLGKRGFVTVEAEEGGQALRVFQADPARFAIAVVDLMMPGMNGYKLVRELRRLRFDLPVIVASGMMGDLEAGQDLAALQEVGVRRVLQKPFEEAELLEAIRAELEPRGNAAALENKG